MSQDTFDTLREWTKGVDSLIHSRCSHLVQGFCLQSIESHFQVLVRSILSVRGFFGTLGEFISTGAFCSVWRAANYPGFQQVTKSFSQLVWIWRAFTPIHWNVDWKRVLASEPFKPFASTRITMTNDFSSMLCMNRESPQKMRSTSNFFGHAHAWLAPGPKQYQKTIFIVWAFCTKVSKTKRSIRDEAQIFVVWKWFLRKFVAASWREGTGPPRIASPNIINKASRNVHKHNKMPRRRVISEKKLPEFIQKSRSWRRSASSLTSSWGTSHLPCQIPRRSFPFSSASLICNLGKLNLRGDDPIRVLTFLPPLLSFHGFSVAFLTTFPGSHRHPYVTSYFLSSLILCSSDSPRESFQSSNRYPCELIYFCLNGEERNIWVYLFRQGWTWIRLLRNNWNLQRPENLVFDQEKCVQQKVSRKDFSGHEERPTPRRLNFQATVSKSPAFIIENQHITYFFLSFLLLSSSSLSSLPLSCLLVKMELNFYHFSFEHVNQSESRALDFWNRLNRSDGVFQEAQWSDIASLSGPFAGS